MKDKDTLATLAAVLITIQGILDSIEDPAVCCDQIELLTRAAADAMFARNIPSPTVEELSLITKELKDRSLKLLKEDQEEASVGNVYSSMREMMG